MVAKSTLQLFSADRRKEHPFRAGDRLPAHRAFALTQKDQFGLMTPGPAVLEVDQSAMKATAVVSTMNRDRDGDIVVPEGCLPTLDNYRRNPVVFFGHQTYPLPIGKAETPDGKLDLTVIPGDRITSTCWFSQSSQDAADIFHLVAEKTLRMTSIGFQPLKVKRLEAEKARQEKPAPLLGWLVELYDLLEWSFVGIPANPFCDVITSHLHRNRISGKTISSTLRKALLPYQLPLKPMAHGCSKGNDMAKKPARRKAVDELPPEDVATGADDSTTPAPDEAANAGTDVQSVALSKEQFPELGQARQWVTEQGYDATAMSETDTTWVFEQFSAADAIPDTSKTEMVEDGVEVVTCQRKTDEGSPEDEEAMKRNRIALLKRLQARVERQLKQLDFGGVAPDDAEDSEGSNEGEEGDEGGDQDSEDETDSESGDDEVTFFAEGEDDAGAEAGSGTAAEDPRDKLIETLTTLYTQQSEMVTAVIGRLSNMVEMMNGIIGSSDDDSVIDDDEDETPSEAEMAVRYSGRSARRHRRKGYMSRRCKACVKEAADYLSHVADKDDLPLAYKSGHRYHAKELGSMMEEATQLAEDDQENTDDETNKKAFGDALAMLTKVAETANGIEKKFFCATGRR